jgi:hypothetical protein
LCGDFCGFDDGVINDPGQRMICKLHGLSSGQAVPIHAVSPAYAYPNPSADRIFLEWPEHRVAQWTIHSLDGRIVLRGTMTIYRSPIEVQCLAMGTYTIALQDTNGISTTLNWTKP